MIKILCFQKSIVIVIVIDSPDESVDETICRLKDVLQ